VRDRDCVLDLGVPGEGNRGLNLAGIRVENLPKPAGRPFHLFAADKVANLPHELSPLEVPAVDKSSLLCSFSAKRSRGSVAASSIDYAAAHQNCTL
jgi:hypothetical protein